MHVRVQALRARLFRLCFLLLVVVGSICLTLFVWQEFEATYFQASLSHTFDEQLRRPAARGEAVESGPPETSSSHSRPALGTGNIVGRLEIPRIGLNVMVLHGADTATLRRGAGLLPDTAEPGEGGNVVIAAHRDTHFRPLRRIKPGDVVRLTTLNARYDYRVQWTAVVDPTDCDILKPTTRPSLTLITCFPFYYVGNAPRRFIVRASRQDVETNVTAQTFPH